MFAAHCGADAVLALWDAYFLADDPFFLFFLSLVLLVNGRDYVFQLARESPTELAASLGAMPSQISVADIPDMCELAEYFASVTPVRCAGGGAGGGAGGPHPAAARQASFRADYASDLFASGRRAPSPAGEGGSGHDVRQTLCLALPVEAVLRHTEGAIKFFLVDTRPLAHFDAGHLPFAWHLDASLMMERPEIFADELSRLEDALEASMQHPCFIGSGREQEDAMMRMVVSQFLQRKHKYVSVVRGGFRALHARLDFEGRLSEALDGYAPARCARYLADPPPEGEGGPAGTETPPTERKMSSWVRGLGNRAAALKASTAAAASAAAAASRRSAAALSERSAGWSKAIGESSKALSARVRAGTSRAGDADGGGGGGGGGMYRGSERARFAIDDDDDGSGDGDDDAHREAGAAGADLDLAGAITKRTRSGDIVVKVERAAAQPRVEYVFQCSEVDAEGYLIPSFLVLTRGHIIKLRDLNRRGEAVVAARRPMHQVLKITAKKKHPNLVTVVYEDWDSPAAEQPDDGAAAAGEAEEGEAPQVLQPPQEPKTQPERFMIPEAEQAKEAFRVLISELPPPPPR